MAEKKHDAGKRELIAPKGDKRYVKRDEEGKFTESVDVSKSLSDDARQHSKTKVKPGHGDEGDGVKKKSPAKKK